MDGSQSDSLLTEEEYQRVLTLLGREPNALELSIFSVLWSEHCSYKSSKIHLNRFPTTGERVIEGPGENAGVVSIGDGLVAVFKIESHNHPSFIEPYQGAATGVGGILRDIFTMGARPIALLDALCFGPLHHPQNRYRFEQVVAGIADYGNCAGVPTVGGALVFDEIYTKNPIVNVFCLGIARREAILRGIAAGEGNPVIYVGSKTGKDGIHGATMASAGLTSTQTLRPTVQVGDPFMEKLLLEACLELAQRGCVVGMQDMGAAGLSCAASEMANRGKVGITLELSKVPLREEGMTSHEIMLSESQERMLMVVTKGREKEAAAIFEKWDIPFAIIGEVTNNRMLTVTEQGNEVARVPAEAVTSNAPIYERPLSPPFFQESLTQLNLSLLPQESSYSEPLLMLLSSLSHADKRWVYQQYDHMVQTNTVLGPGHGAAVLRIKGSDNLLALTVDGSGLYTLLNPYWGGVNAVVEAARNLVAVGAKPIGMTNGLNFGNPERPGTMWALSLCIEGMSDACRALSIPVVSGNVSLYNETAGLDIYPTPWVGMVGLIEPPSQLITPAFKAKGDRILLLGETKEELGGSTYCKEIHAQERGLPPLVHLEREKAIQRAVLRANPFLSSAQDLSEGGLAIAVAECCLLAKQGAFIEIHSPSMRTDAYLFSESPSRILVTVREALFNALKGLLEEEKVPYTLLGRVGGDDLTIRMNDKRVVHLSVDKMREAHEEGLSPLRVSSLTRGRSESQR